ncbi:MAG TPA: hypothetical protein H9957_05740, partial [Candidatus Dorea stercoravium]|nr:hypothetical protein [Candidatus Dorea stercoravium]
MKLSFKRGLFIVTLTGVISISGEKAEASDRTAEMSLPGVGIEAVLDGCSASDREIDVESYLVPSEKGEYSNMAFANVSTDT